MLLEVRCRLQFRDAFISTVWRRGGVRNDEVGGLATTADATGTVSENDEIHVPDLR